MRDLLASVTIKSPGACSTSLGHLSNEMAVSSCCRGEGRTAFVSFCTIQMQHLGFTCAVSI